jgi:hypothetical protein
MSAKNFNTEQTKKLNQVINEGMQVMHEIETLTGGLNDTVKAIAEELEIKPNVLKKAIRWHTRVSLVVSNRIMSCWNKS